MYELAFISFLTAISVKYWISVIGSPEVIDRAGGIFVRVNDYMILAWLGRFIAKKKAKAIQDGRFPYWSVALCPICLGTWLSVVFFGVFTAFYGGTWWLILFCPAMTYFFSRLDSFLK